MVVLRTKAMEFLVGLFMLAAVGGLLILAFKVSGLTQWLGGSHYYQLTANFDNVGGLKTRAPVSVGGVKIGEVASIVMDPKTFQAKVVLDINDNVNKLPKDTSASILTQGLLGANYVSLTPGFDQENIKPGGVIEQTNSAMILENLIGQLLFSVKDKGK